MKKNSYEEGKKSYFLVKMAKYFFPDKCQNNSFFFFIT